MGNPKMMAEPIDLRLLGKEQRIISEIRLDDPSLSHPALWEYILVRSLAPEPGWEPELRCQEEIKSEWEAILHRSSILQRKTNLLSMVKNKSWQLQSSAKESK